MPPVHSGESDGDHVSPRRQLHTPPFELQAHLRHEQRCPSEGQLPGAQHSVSGNAPRLHSRAFGCALTSQWHVAPLPNTGAAQRVTVPTVYGQALAQLFEMHCARPSEASSFEAATELARSRMRPQASRSPPAQLSTSGSVDVQASLRQQSLMAGWHSRARHAPHRAPTFAKAQLAPYSWAGTRRMQLVPIRADVAAKTAIATADPHFTGPA